MDRRVEVDVAAPADTVGEALCDLACYVRWLDLVAAVEPANPAPDDPGPAWWVTIRARLGPLARAKRLRMARVEHEPRRSARFERFEIDGRSHSPWTLDVAVEEAGDDTSRASLLLLYGGPLWSSVLDGVLSEQIKAAVPSLETYLAGR